MWNEASYAFKGPPMLWLRPGPENCQTVFTTMLALTHTTFITSIAILNYISVIFEK